MFYPNARVDMLLLDFQTKQPITLYSNLKEASLLTDNSKLYDLKTKQTSPLIIQKSGLNAFVVSLNGLDKTLLQMLLPLKQQPKTSFTDFIIWRDGIQPKTLSNIDRIIEVGILSENGERVPQPYDYANNTLTLQTPTEAQTFCIATFNKPNTNYELREQPITTPFFTLLIKQEIKHENQTTETLTIRLPKVSVKNGLDYFMANLGKNSNNIPLTFLILGDCAEKVEFTFWRED